MISVEYPLGPMKINSFDLLKTTLQNNVDHRSLRGKIYKKQI